MATFDYKAKDRKGITVMGTVEAPDERLAAAMIREMGHLPMDIRMAKSTSNQITKEAGTPFERFFIYPLWTGVNIKSLAFFFRQLATLLGSGMSLSESLRSAGSRTGGRLGRIIAEACNDVQAGERFSDSISRHPRVFSLLQISLVRAGESGGMMEIMVDKIASYLEYEISIRQRIAKITFYPFIIFFFIVFSPHLPVLVLKGGSAFLTSLWASLSVWLPWAILGIVILKLLLQFEITRLIWDSIKVVPPVLGTLARKIAMSRFSRAFAVLYAAGMPVAEAVSVSADASANIAIGRSIKHAVPAIQSGKGLTESLTKTRAIMPMVLDMLATGEKTGNMDAVLLKVADYMDEETDATIHKAGIVLFGLIMLIAGWVVLKMVMAFYSGYFKSLLEQTGE